MMPGQIPSLQRILSPALEKNSIAQRQHQQQQQQQQQHSHPHHLLNSPHTHNHHHSYHLPPHVSSRLQPLPPQTTLGHHLHQQQPAYIHVPHTPIQPLQNHQQQHQHTQHVKAQSEQQHRRRGSTDRSSTKDSTRSSPSLKAQPEYVGPYLLGKTLGKGSSGCVKLARHRKTNEQVAVKIISKASLANRAAVHRGIEREIAIMKLINHPHVIRLYDVYETEKELFLVMEYVSGGELFEYLVNKGRLEEAEALRFFQQIIVGLAFCHKRKICHRDLKPENLLLDTQMNVKIADFGMASLQKTGRLLETSCGSPHYASPEVVTGMKYDGASSDIWSCGIILYALLTGHLPFDDENIRQLLSKVKAGKFYMPTDISPGARDLISRMLTVNPRRRITMQGVMMHPWFRMVNPVRNTLKEPVQEPEDAGPLEIDELDAEIIRHMRWLFAPGPSHADPEGKTVFDEEALLTEIQEKVMNEEENMEKLFYRLLCQHKTELLENYAGDECDTQPDAPRRRADSFPNSATCSIRSNTPDFSLTPMSPGESPLTSPGSPLSPIIKGTDPTPLTLNPEPSSIKGPNPTQLEHMNGIRRGQSPTKAGECKTLRESVLGPDSRRGSEESAESSRSSSGSSNGRRSIDRDPALLSKPSGPSKGMFKEDSGRGVDVARDENAQMSLPSRIIPPVIVPSAELPPIHPMDISAPPPYYHDNDSALRKQPRVSYEGNTIAPSIESQVISTQISEATNSSATRSGVVTAPIIFFGSTVSSRSSERLKSAAFSTRTQRPILHPLDVKPSASMTATNVPASPHTRKYSEGNPPGLGTSGPSPTAPKRHWFARLFDFKPQPLTFQSNLSAIETQERLEMLLKEMFRSSIQVENLKKPPSFGFKCKYEGGVLDEKTVKAVKFKVDIAEKTVFHPHRPEVIENLGGASTPVSPSGGSSTRTVSSSAIATILATVEMNQNGQQQQQQQQLQQPQQHQHHTHTVGARQPVHRRSLFGRNGFYHHIHHNNSSSTNNSNATASTTSTTGSSSSSSTNSGSAGGRSVGALVIMPAAIAAGSVGAGFHPLHSGQPIELSSPPPGPPPKLNTGRRASDGGSILSSAAAAVTSHFASRLPFHYHQHNHHHRHHDHHDHSHNSRHQQYASSPSSSTAGSNSFHRRGSTGAGTCKRVVKVTLNQQQGANSTLKLVHERLVAAWELYEQQIVLELQQQQRQRQLESLQAAASAAAPSVRSPSIRVVS